MAMLEGGNCAAERRRVGIFKKEKSRSATTELVYVVVYRSECTWISGKNWRGKKGE